MEKISSSMKDSYCQISLYIKSQTSEEKIQKTIESQHLPYDSQKLSDYISYGALVSSIVSVVPNYIDNGTHEVDMIVERHSSSQNIGTSTYTAQSTDSVKNFFNYQFDDKQDNKICGQINGTNLNQENSKQNIESSQRYTQTFSLCQDKENINNSQEKNQDEKQDDKSNYFYSSKSNIQNEKKHNEILESVINNNYAGEETEEKCEVNPISCQIFQNMNQ